MPNSADEQIIIEIVVETSEVLADITNFRKEVDLVKAKLKEFADATGESVSVVGQRFKTAFAQGKIELGEVDELFGVTSISAERFGKVTTQAVKEVAQEEDKATQSTKLFGIELGKLGDIGRLVFGSVLGISAVTAIREIIQLFKSAAGEAIGFSQELFKLGASTRALQRSGLDITIADVSKKITELRKEFKVFSQREIVNGLAQIQLYTRQLGFTVEQQDQMIDSVATLSLVMGKDFGETARSVALFLSSGYGESLQRAGIVDANRATVAQELLALGFNKSFNEATQQERALAGLNILLRGTADLSDETAAAQETLAGEVKELTSRWNDLLLALGQELPVGAFVGIITGLIEDITTLITTFNNWGLILAAVFAIPIAQLSLIANLSEAIVKFWTGEEIEIDIKIPDFLLEGEDELKSRMKDLGEDAAKAFTEGFEDEFDPTDLLEEIEDELEKEGEKLRNRLDAIGRDVDNDLEKISRDIQDNIDDIWADFGNKITDILAKLQQQIADAIRRAALQRAQVLRQAAIKEAEINRKYRERELKAERDYQEALRRLREDFLLDLEDALRERDALQVLRLTKKYNLEQERLRRERENEKEDLERQRREELEQLKIQTAERLRVLQEELQARIEALQIAADREQEQAFINAQRREEQERIEEERRKREREIRAEQQRIEEEERSKERLEAWAKELAENRGLTETELELLLQTLDDIYGEGGIVQGIMTGLQDVLVEMNEEIAEAARVAREELLRVIAHIRALNNMSVGSPQPQAGGPKPNYQEGGIHIAGRPTTVTFGEAGWEAATFTPLNRIGKNEGKIFGDKLPTFGGRGNGKLALDIMLSKGLEAQIVEAALDEVADVIVNVQRKR